MTPEQIGALASSLGIPALFAFILLRWVLGKLNGSITDIAKATRTNTDALRELTRAVKRSENDLASAVDALGRAIKGDRRTA